MGQQQMESQQPSSSSAAAAAGSPSGILLLEELSQCNQMIRQLMVRKEEDDKTLKCLTQYILGICQHASQSDELKMQDVDKQMEEGQQQKLQFQKQLVQKGVEMIRMIEVGQQKQRDQLDELTLFKELMWRKIAEMARKKPAGRRLPNELCAEIVKAMPLSAKLTQIGNWEGTVIGQYIQDGLNKISSLTPNNFWDKDHCSRTLALSGDQLTVTFDTQVAVDGYLLAKLPIPACADGIFYYEIYLKEGNSMDIGVLPCGTGAPWYPNWSWCYTASGDLWVNGEVFREFFGDGQGFGVGDWMGCGVHLATRKLFFTRNGEFLGIAVVLPVPAFAEPINVFPDISFDDVHAIVETNFGRQPFKWRCTDADLATMREGNRRILDDDDEQRLAEAIENWNNG